MRSSGGRDESRPYTLTVRPCRGCDAPDAVHLKPGLTLTVGHRTPGLRIKRAGGRGTRKLQDILVDAKVPRSQRDTLPLLFANGELACVPGLAMAAEFAPEPGGWSEHVVVESAHRATQGVSL
jgi:tRNA(Ile)-lysidine synthetase-like protein